MMAVLPASYLVFSGDASYVEASGSHAFSVGDTGLSIAVWMRPDVLTFDRTEHPESPTPYIHWLGKGDGNRHEWTFRMYSQPVNDAASSRGNRISFYVFNADGGRGCGSYFQDPIVAGSWMHVVGVADPAAHETTIYKNGVWRHSDSYAPKITPAPADAPLRLGTKDEKSFLKGAIGPVLIWNRPLAESEVRDFFNDNRVPPDAAARYDLSEGHGSIAHDSIGGQDGTLQSVRWSRRAAPLQDTVGTSGGGC
jgi:concanavalin A-like lectin/glucanase superfamily protein